MLRHLEMIHCSGLIVAASVPLRQLTRLDIFSVEGGALPWQHVQGMQSLTLRRCISPDLLEGSPQLTALHSLLLHLHSGDDPPPGASLASVPRLVLNGVGNAEVGCC